jgi:hypothetical protein
MNEDYFNNLYRLVRRAVADDDAGMRRAWHAINLAHMCDRADGRVFTRPALGPLRVYRNNVSSDPQHLIDAAQAFQEETANAND